MAKSDAPISIDAVTLAVRDLPRVAAFYEDVIGLAPLTRDGASATLGVAGRPLVTLLADPAAPLALPHEAGLFHTAFLLPSRAALGGWLRHAATRDVALEGASDHVVSEALYLSDPEGNGIEIYADRPRETWQREGGIIVMRTDPLDLAALAAAGEAWHGAPDGTVIGHVHLKVGALDPAEAFWRDRVGLDVTCRYHGATFLSSGGYHHHIGANVWRSRGAPAASGPRTGLRRIALCAAAGALDPAAERVDPWGIEIAVVARPETAARASVAVG